MVYVTYIKHYQRYGNLMILQKKCQINIAKYYSLRIQFESYKIGRFYYLLIVNVFFIVQVNQYFLPFTWITLIITIKSRLTTLIIEYNIITHSPRYLFVAIILIPSGMSFGSRNLTCLRHPLGTAKEISQPHFFLKYKYYVICVPAHCFDSIMHKIEVPFFNKLIQWIINKKHYSDSSITEIKRT